MRSRPVVAHSVALTVVALAMLLACLPGRAVELIDLQATRQPPGQPPGQVLANQPAYFPALRPAYFPAYFPTYSPTYFPLRSTPYFPHYFPHHQSAQPVRYIPAEDWADLAWSAILPDLPLPVESPPPAVMAAVPMPVPEPVSVLMLACGLLMMMPGAWAVRWSRLGDSESLLQRRLP